MKIINILYIFITIIILICSFVIKTITLGQIWKNIHVNSLIGLQKISETIALKINIKLDIWGEFFLPILNLNFLFILVLLQSVIIIFILKK